jgi:HAMP domain-containing protein
VRAATTTYVFAPSKDLLFNKAITPENAVALRTAVEKGRLMIALPAAQELPWLVASAVPPAATVIPDADRPVIARDATESVSDTGELRRNWDAGVYTVDTPQTQAATGRLGGRVITLRDVEIRIRTALASVVVQSLDNVRLGSSFALLISLGAASEPLSPNQLPFRSEQVVGELAIRAPAGLKLYARLNAQEQRREIPSTYSDGRYRIQLDETLRTYWLMLN